MSDELATSKKPGILRVEVRKRTSSASVEFKDNIVEPTSPQPSVDRLSVSFANNDKKPEDPKGNKELTSDGGKEDKEDDFTASVSAILEKGRGDWRRRSSRRRRSSSSPLSARRRSSVFTFSSGDTTISVEDDVQGQVFQNLRIPKEVVAHVKYQPWPIQKKLQLVQAAKSYIKQHEGQIQERLARRTSAKDILAHINILLRNSWNYIKRELANLANNMIPWEPRIKQIESHFGSVVASYFTFLRWIFYVNLISAVILVVFLAVPEVLFGDITFSGDRKVIPREEWPKALNFLTLWNFEGVLKYSPLFYGYYNSENEKNNILGNRLPLIYFMVSLGVYFYSFVAILRKMALNSRQSKLSEKDDDCIFTWKMFTSWDFMIGNPETSHNRKASIILGFKEALLEEAEKTREEGRNWKLLSLRIFTHINVIWLLGSSMYAVIKVVGRSEDNSLKERNGWWRQNEVTIVMTLIGNIYPIIFDFISYLEKYHPRKALRLQLTRIMVLNLLNLYSFIFATFSVIHGKSNRLTQLKRHLVKIIPNITDAKIITKRPPTLSQGIRKSMAVATLIMANVIGITQIENTTELDVTPNVNLEQFTTYSEERLPLWQQFNLTTEYSDNISISESTQAAYSSSSPPYGDGIYDELPVTVGDEEYETEQSTVSNISTMEDKSDNATTFLYSDSTPDWTTSYPDNSDTASESTSNISTMADNAHNTTTSLYNDSIPGWTTSQPSYPASESLDAQTTLSYITTPLQPTDNPCKVGCRNVTTNKTGVKEASSDRCTVVEDSTRGDLSLFTRYLSRKQRKELHILCWETMFGQELLKLTVMDLCMTVLGILMGDFARALFVRFMNSCWCWDLEKRFPQYADFKMAENILHLVNNQGMVWMGMFFSPGLPLINVLKLIVIMYMRSWAVLTCNIPHEVVFRASRSNNFYFWLLLMMLFLCVLPVGYTLVWIEPSWHCGPFSNYNKIYYLFTSSLKKLIPSKGFNRVLDYLASPSVVIPLLMLLILIIFYLLSLTYALREANDDLKIQLRRERTEERRKMFQIANKKRRGTEQLDTPFNKWCKMINADSLRKISLDNTANTIKDEKVNNVNQSHENRTCDSVKISKGDDSTVTNKNDKKPKRRRKDAIASIKSSENVPEIKICQTDLGKAHRLEEPSAPKASVRDKIQEVSAGGNDKVFEK